MTRITGRHGLIAMLGFFGIVLGVNVLFVMLAVGSFSGEVEPKSYLQGLHYNEVLAERAEQRERNWSATVAVTDARDRITVRVVDAEGRPLNDLALEGEIRRPATDAFDRPLVFASIGDGRFAADVEPLDDGVWEVIARGDDSLGRSFETSRRLWLR